MWPLERLRPNTFEGQKHEIKVKGQSQQYVDGFFQHFHIVDGSRDMLYDVLFHEIEKWGGGDEFPLPNPIAQR